MKKPYRFSRYDDDSRLFTLKTDQAIPLLQAETAKMLGLGSSDEITVTNVNGAQRMRWAAKKTFLSRHYRKGRIFDSSLMMREF